MLDEDALDCHLIKWLKTKSNNRLVAVDIPTRSFANLTRFKAPWYRDSRPVRNRTAAMQAVKPIPGDEN